MFNNKLIWFLLLLQPLLLTTLVINTVQYFIDEWLDFHEVMCVYIHGPHASPVYIFIQEGRFMNIAAGTTS